MIHEQDFRWNLNREHNLRISRIRLGSFNAFPPRLKKRAKPDYDGVGAMLASTRCSAERYEQTTKQTQKAVDLKYGFPSSTEDPCSPKTILVFAIMDLLNSGSLGKQINGF